MNGRPLTALSIVCYPEDGDLDALQQILVGGLEKMIEAKCVVVGGHMVRDREVKFGYAVTGTAAPNRVWTNAGAVPGDQLILTKPLGTGLIATALRAAKAEPAWIDAAVRVMSRLNRDAAVALNTLSEAVHSVTDITGFGFLGHAWEVATASGVSLLLQSRNIQALEGALECARNGFIAGGLNKNREFVGSCAEFAPGVGSDLQYLLFDPQTSGGLLASVDPGFAEKACTLLAAAGCPAMRVGEVIQKASPPIRII
jgi:selenide,water dikinase